MKNTIKVLAAIALLCYLSTLPQWDEIASKTKTTIETMAQSKIYQVSSEYIKGIFNAGKESVEKCIEATVNENIAENYNDAE